MNLYVSLNDASESAFTDTHFIKIELVNIYNTLSLIKSWICDIFDIFWNFNICSYFVFNILKCMVFAFFGFTTYFKFRDFRIFNMFSKFLYCSKFLHFLRFSAFFFSYFLHFLRFSTFSQISIFCSCGF